MTTGCVLDVLIYVYDHYMMADPADIPSRAQMFSELAREGFTLGEVVQAMEWLSVLAGHSSESASENSQRPSPGTPGLGTAGLMDFFAREGSLGTPSRALRVYSEGELGRLSPECRTFLARLDRDGVLTPEQRELVIERTLALDVEEPTFEQLRWVVLLVLSVQPRQEAAFARFEALMVGEHSSARH